jgi:hypothetical protein
MNPTIVSIALRGQLLATLLLLCAASPARANEAALLPAKGDACKTLRSEAEFSLWQCHGPAGYGFSYADSVMQGGLTFGLESGPDQPSPQDIHWAPANEGIGSRIEWRMSNGKPYAAIIGRWRHPDLESDTVLEELLVVKVLPHDGCEVGTIGAFTPDAMAAARRLADTRAPAFKCRVDKPVTLSDAANGSVGKLDRQFGPAEMLEHNGSLVALTRQADGSIDIRYQQPKATLPVSQGAMLFRGQEKAGVISGIAFVFKQGCKPAGYQVTGKRAGGVLLLEGTAPHRDPHSCAIIAARSASKHSNLVFYHEPVTDEHFAAGIAPMTISQCGKCMPATVKTIEGVSTTSAHVEAEITPDNVRDYCENWTFGSDRMPACMAENAAEIGKTQRAAADCSGLTVQPSSGGSYKFFKVAEDSGERVPVWKDVATGQVECNAHSCNGLVATAHFSLLCPGAIPGWSGYHY